MQWAEFQFNVRHLTETDQTVVRKAFELGAKAHGDQKRKSGEPYFTHPIAVAHILADLGGDRDTIVAGLLHDTVEDTPLSLEDIAREFGPAVATLIDGVTKLEQVDVAGKPRLDEQIETLRKMFTLMQQDVRIMVIKLADRLHNMQTIGFMPAEKQMRVARETTDVYVKVADRLCMRDLQNDLEALALAVLEPELHARLQELRTAREAKGRDVVRQICQQLASAETDLLNRAECLYEQKTWSRLREQLKTQGRRITGMATMAMAIVCDDVGQCYQVLGVLHQEWQRELLSFEDFINSPMINGYRALHTTIILEDGTRVRCKIRTKEMQDYAHRGITLFCFDNRSRGPLEYLPWTQRIAAISSDTSDRSEEFWEGLQSDILGSTIAVHGPDDRAVMLPSGSTALDGAFYLFGDMALQVTELRVNGDVTTYDAPLANAATLSATFSTESQANLRWLHSVHTAVASAIIRKQLAAAPRTEKLALGRELLDIALQRFMRLRYAEIDPSLFARRLLRLGLRSQDDLLEQIAEGKIEAPEVTAVLFSDFRKRGKGRTGNWLLRADVPAALEERFIRTARAYPANRISTEHADGHAVISVRLSVNQSQADALEHSLGHFLAPHTWTMRRATSTPVFAGFVGLLLTLWGLDPVAARALLQGGISPYDLTFIRAVTFFVASAALYSGQLAIYGRRLKWLSPLHPTLILSGVALFITAFFSYVALGGVAATTYILCIVGGLLGAALFHEVLGGKRWFHTAVSLLMISAAIVVAAFTLGYTNFSLLAGIGSGLGFTLYSELSRRYQREEEAIRARYPAFLFWMSCVGLALSMLLLPLTTFDRMTGMQAAMSVLFVLAFSVIPYSLYFEITRRMEAPIVDRSLPLVAVIAILGELVFSSSIAPLLALPLLLLFLAQYYGLYDRAWLRKASSSARP